MKTKAKTFTTYLGDQLVTEPDRVKVEYLENGSISCAYVDGICVHGDDLEEEIGELEYDRIRLLALEKCGDDYALEHDL
jgi:hypothetical protein